MAIFYVKQETMGFVVMFVKAKIPVSMDTVTRFARIYEEQCWRKRYLAPCAKTQIKGVYYSKKQLKIENYSYMYVIWYLFEIEN